MGHKGRWSGDIIEFIGYHDDRIDSILADHANISLLILDELSEDNELFIREIIQRAIRNPIWGFNLIAALIVLIDNDKFYYFRHYGSFYYGDKWDETILSLRIPYLESPKREIYNSIYHHSPQDHDSLAYKTYKQLSTHEYFEKYYRPEAEQDAAANP
jgi:hypothetical protein